MSTLEFYIQQQILLPTIEIERLFFAILRKYKIFLLYEAKKVISNKANSVKKKESIISRKVHTLQARAI